MITHPGYPDLYTSPTSPSCVARGCKGPDGEPRPATEHSDLCLVHHERFPRVLLDIAGLWPTVSGAVLRRPVAAESGTAAPKGSSIRDVGALWNEAASSALHDGSDWVAFLVRLVRSERPGPDARIRTVARTRVFYRSGVRVERVVHAFLPDSRTPISHGFPDDASPAALLHVLINRHSRWLSGHPDTGLGAQLLADAIELRGRMIASIEGSTVRVVKPHGLFCKAVVSEFITASGEIWDEVCDAQLYGIVRPDDGAHASRLTCSVNPAHLDLPASAWMRYAAGA